ncbi:MAG: DUF4129 domain-containing protein [Bacteroidota bacterium]
MNWKNIYNRLPSPVLLLGLLMLPGLWVQVQGDEVPWQGRNFDESRLEEYRNSDQYQYNQEPQTEQDKRQSESAQGRPIQQRKVPSGPRFSMSEVSNVFYLLAGIAIIAVAAYILSSRLQGSGQVFLKDQVPKLEEDIRDMDFDQLIKEALGQGNFRYATRLVYLETLKILSEKGKIDWEPNKTNQDYVRELQKEAFAPQFDRLTLSYDYIWYGNFPINQDQFARIRAVFQDFQTHIRR